MIGTMYSSRPLRLLLAMSSTATRRALVALLRKEYPHCTPVECASYAQALEMYRQQPFDLLLLGDQGEGGGPLAFLEALEPLGPWHPVLFIHGGQENELVLEALRAGAQDALDIGRLSSRRLSWSLDKILHVQELRTQNQRMNAELTKSNQELLHFAHGVSHDLREPLRKIRSFGALLGESLEGRLDEEQSFFLDRMLDGAQRMEERIQALLRYAQAGRSHDQDQWTSLGQSIGHVSEDLSLSLEESGAILEITGELPTVHAEPVRLQQLLQNLLGNSIKYRRLDVPLHIRLSTERQDNGSCRLLVEDNGKGFAPDQSEAIFNLFHRAQESANSYGIGLALCRRIVESLGGTLSARSIPGEGATFVVELPDVRWS